MCQVSPDHVAMLTAFGTLFFCGGVLSVMTGQTYYRGLIYRAEEPFMYWSTTIGMLLIGGMCILGVAFCPRA